MTSKENLHSCDMSGYPQDGYGDAINFCQEKEDGTFWVYNYEYGSQVNFCPACGLQAKVKVLVIGK